MFNIEIDVPCILDSNRSGKDLQELFRALEAQLWRPAAVLCNVLATAVERQGRWELQPRPFLKERRGKCIYIYIQSFLIVRGMAQFSCVLL